MNFQDYIRYDAVGLAELIRKKEVSADEVLQAALNRLDEVNPKLNLLAHDLRERAAAWQGSSENADTPLAGVPFLLKDLLADWEGAPTWSGSRMMQHYIAKQNSDLTQAYLDAGLRVFGKPLRPNGARIPLPKPKFTASRAIRGIWITPRAAAAAVQRRQWLRASYPQRTAATVAAPFAYPRTTAACSG